MKTKTILNLAACLLLSCGAEAQILYDDFNGTSVNTSLWTIGLPESDASVTEGGGYVSLENAGRITTQMSMPASYAVYGSFLIANNPFSNFKVVLRSDGAIYGDPAHPVEESAGIAFEFNVEDDNGTTTDNLKLFSIGDPAGDFFTPDATASLTLNTWHTFLITDDGFNLELYFDGSSTPSLSAESTFGVGGLVTFYNRQGAASGSSISANGITELDYINIVSVPEPPSVAMICLGILSLMGMRRWNWRVTSSASVAHSSTKL